MSGAVTNYRFPADASRRRRTALAPDSREPRSIATDRPIEPALLEADDPRWVLALRVREQMQGPMLTPDARQRLEQLGRTLGLTPFEANLVMAIVQDQARHGGDLQAAAPSLVMVPQHNKQQRVNRWNVAAWVLVLLGIEAAILLGISALLSA
jgi:hypothetical protein